MTIRHYVVRENKKNIIIIIKETPSSSRFPGANEMVKFPGVCLSTATGSL